MTDLPIVQPAFPEIFLALAIMGQMMVGAFAKPEKAVSLVISLSLLSLVLATLLVFHTGFTVQLAFFGQFKVDPLAYFMKILVLIAAIAIMVISLPYIKREGMGKFEYPILLSFATLGMMMMISANDLMALYLGLELQSLSLYVIAAFRRNHPFSAEAGLKYFILGAVASGLLLYGCSLVYGFTGTTAFPVLAERFATAPPHLGAVIGMVFIITAMAFKISAVPFHMWTPDVYEGAPTSVTAFFAVAPKIAAIALLIRLMMEPFGALVSEWQQVIIILSALSMVLGAVAAVAQTNIKRLMAYSSIGHMGFALIGLAAGTQQGIQSVLVYMMLYMVMSVGVFGCILYMKVKGKMVENIKDLSGLSKTKAPMALAMLILMFSMAGIPPFIGFWGKYYVFIAGVEAGLTWLVIVGALASVVGAFYYLRVIKVCFFDAPLEKLDAADNFAMNSVIAVSACLTVGLFIILPWVTAPAMRAAAGLFVG